MPLPLSTAKMTSKRKGSGKVITEYKGKASPKRTGAFNGATTRRQKGTGKK
jgi:hypothetical protein